MRVLSRLWKEEEGFYGSIELLIIATLLLCAVVVGGSALRVSVATEFADLAQAVANLDQSYSFGNILGHHATCAGSAFIDGPDSCDNDPDQTSKCVTVCGAAESEGNASG